MADIPHRIESAVTNIASMEDSQLNDSLHSINDRFAISNVFQVIPLGEGGNLLHDESFLATGKDVSTNGIALSHLSQVTCRRAVLSSVHPAAGRFAVEAEIAWTRPSEGELYETDFRLVRKLAAHPLRSG